MNFKFMFIGLNLESRVKLMEEIETTDLEIGGYTDHISESERNSFLNGNPTWFTILGVKWENHYEDGYSYKTVYDNGRSILNDSDNKYNNGGW